jgi:acyl-CoA thioesterase
MLADAITHGGCVFALADTAFALACNGYGRFTVTAGATITFVAPSSVGDVLIAEAVERVRRGRSTGANQVRLPMRHNGSQ